MKVTLHRRLGQNPAGATVEVTETQARWLAQRGLGAIATTQPTVEQPREAPATVEYSPETHTTSDTDAEDDLPTGTLTQLRDQASALGVPVRGSKAELARRIQAARAG